jgi:hypothetical protein
MASIVLSILGMLTGPVLSYFSRRQDIAAAAHKTDVETGLARDQAEMSAQGVTNADKASFTTSWVLRGFQLAVGVAFGGHLVALAWTLSAPARYTWPVHVFPSPLNELEVAVVGSLFLVGPVYSYFKK